MNEEVLGFGTPLRRSLRKKSLVRRSREMKRCDHSGDTVMQDAYAITIFALCFFALREPTLKRLIEVPNR
jgi:hypothetical protein